MKRKEIKVVKVLKWCKFYVLLSLLKETVLTQLDSLFGKEGEDVPSKLFCVYISVRTFHDGDEIH